MDKKEIVVKIDEIDKFVREGSSLIFKKNAEESLVSLLELKDKVDLAIEQVKKGIAEAGRTISPDFKGVIGSKVKALFRSYGKKYRYDWNKRGELGEFLRQKTYYEVISDKVDEYIKKNKKLPDGIEENDREPVISLSLIGKEIKEKI